MGEQLVAARESIYDNQADVTYLGIDDNLPINDVAVYLYSFNLDSLICVHNVAFGYNKGKFNSALEEALMFKGQKINGETLRDC